MSNDVEKIWNEEVREKKRAASGVHSRTGKRGYVGTMRTPADLLKGQAKRDYQASSPVTTTSLYEPLIDLDEFKKLPRSKKMILIHQYRQLYSARDIAEHWGIAVSTAHYYFRQYSYNKNDSADEQGAKIDAEAPAGSKRAHETKRNLHDAKRTCEVAINGEFAGEEISRLLEGRFSFPGKAA